MADLFGLGGGIVIVPALFFLYLRQGFPAKLCIRLAVGSSLATVVFTSITSAMVQNRHGAVRWPVVRRLGLGIVGGRGARGGTRRARDKRVPAGVRSVAPGRGPARAGPAAGCHRELPGTGGMWLVGMAIGALCLLGIGGGTLTVPLLVYTQYAHPSGRGHLRCPFALGGAIGFVVADWDEVGLPAESSGYPYWPAVTAVVAGSAFLAPQGRASPMPCRSRPCAGVRSGGRAHEGPP